MAGENRCDQLDFERSCCPITNVLDLMGDKWSMLIIRDIFLGKSRFVEFTQSPERIPSNILSSRLNRLVASGLLCKTCYQDKPVRYRYTLTRKGRDLQPVLEAMEAWAKTHIPGVMTFPLFIPSEEMS